MRNTCFNFYELRQGTIMKSTRPLDTSLEAERVQIESFRRMTPERRLRAAAELTQLVRKSLAEGVRMRHPEYKDEQVHLAVIRLILPEKLFLVVYPHAKEIFP
jgi:hypothetical protein